MDQVKKHPRTHELIGRDQFERTDENQHGRAGADRLHDQVPEQQRTLPKITPARLSEKKSGVTRRSDGKQRRRPHHPRRTHPVAVYLRQPNP